jgi:hypothetical protein
MALRKTIKELHIRIFFHSAKARALRDSVPFSVTKEYLLSIATDECPIFHTPFEWGMSGAGRGHAKPNGPTLDRIEPSLGYVEGNVAFISYRANRLKDNGTMQEHYDIADWIWNHLYAKTNTTPPIPKRTNLQGAVGNELGSISSPWTWEDYNDAYDYWGTVQRENTNHSAQEGSGDSLGCRGTKVATLIALTRLENNGEPNSETVRLEYRGRYLPDKP